ncbi:MAG TPA: hypothetical protein VLY03_03535 [Bacteroidota bacterium]|nr:hypothetical protein [Bacteroidota bacterium]
MYDTERVSFWEFISTRWGLLKFLGVLVFAGVFIWILIDRMLPRMMESFNSPGITSIESNRGATVIAFNSGITIVNLPSSVPWASTHMVVKKGQTLSIKASGTVNLGLQSLVKALDNIQTGTRPEHLWLDPAGQTFDKKVPGDITPISAGDENGKKADSTKGELRRYLVRPGSPYGALIAGISSREDLPPGPGDSTWEIGTEWNGEVPANGTLWFVVNDILFTEGSPAPDPKSFSKSTVEVIRKAKYWNAFYDDNLGSFLITLKKM